LPKRLSNYVPSRSEPQQELANRNEPLKNDFYAAAFRYGHQDVEAIAEHLGLDDAYDEHVEMVS
jgi:hypothetical protein